MSYELKNRSQIEIQQRRISSFEGKRTFDLLTLCVPAVCQLVSQASNGTWSHGWIVPQQSSKNANFICKPHFV